jgi:hypothetical protein
LSTEAKQSEEVGECGGARESSARTVKDLREIVTESKSFEASGTHTNWHLGLACV